jgi:hypothetical protein
MALPSPLDTDIAVNPNRASLLSWRSNSTRQANAEKTEPQIELLKSSS